jgi:hypothetical protein
VTCSTFPFCLYLSCGGVCLKLSVIFLSFCHILRNLCSVECRSSLFLNIQWKRIYLKKMHVLFCSMVALQLVLSLWFFCSQVPIFSSFPAYPNGDFQMFPVMYPALVPGLNNLQNQEQINRGSGIYAVPVFSCMGHVTGLPSNTLVPLTYNIPT